ncbi:MAG: sulfotransferase domain-containing protein [Planctomycetota bacterium]
MKRKPNLFIVGAPKCGTTAWYEYLRRHKDISFSTAKEPHYFCSDFPGFRWAKTEAEYIQLFSSLPDTKYLGDASIMYLFSDIACQKIAEFNPEAKILIFVRRYDKFFQSYHAQLVLMHDESELSLEQAWRLCDERAAGRKIPKTCRERSFLNYQKVGCFGRQIERVRQHFPSEQIKVIVFEEWIKDPSSAYSEILNFLGVQNDGFADFRAINEKRRDRNRVLGRILYRPPRLLLSLAKVLKRLLRLKRLNVAQRIRDLNQAKNTQNNNLTHDLSMEIVDHFSEDRKILEAYLGRTIVEWDLTACEDGSMSSFE